MANGASSRCCSLRLFPLTWQDYAEHTHPQVVELDAWFRSLPPFAQAHEQGAINDLFEAAALGKLEESGDAKTKIKPITSEPEVYELRHQVLKMKFRFYHGEPPAEKDLLLKLHKQIKTDGSSQDEAIKQAGKRFDLWYDE